MTILHIVDYYFLKYFSIFHSFKKEGVMAGPNLKKIEIKEINYMRDLVGIKKIKTKRRECLQCGKKFISNDIGHRICDKCRPTWASISRY